MTRARNIATAPTNAFGFKNRIINGAMEIWQRGTSFTSAGSATYAADRFFGNASSGTLSRSTDVPAGLFKYSFRNDASSTAFPGITQRIESVNIADCASKAITVSFYAKQLSGTASALNINLGYPTAVDNYSSSTTIVETNVVAAMSTWARYSYTYTLPANVANGLSVTLFVPSASVTGIFQITGIQVEKGSTATSFDYRPYTTELQLCQRYYYRTTSLPLGYIINVADLYAGSVKFPVTMRTTPTLDSSGNSWAVTGGSAGTVGLRSGTGWGPNSDQAVTYNASSNWSAGNAAALTAGFSSEL